MALRAKLNKLKDENLNMVQAISGKGKTITRPRPTRTITNRRNLIEYRIVMKNKSSE